MDPLAADDQMGTVCTAWDCDPDVAYSERKTGLAEPVGVTVLSAALICSTTMSPAVKEPTT